MTNLDSSRPSSNVAARAGLARYRQLQVQPQQENSSSKSNLPSGWFYNETRQDKFWDDLESKDPNYNQGPSDEFDQARAFNDIGTAANRVQALLQQFDAIDQDTLMELMQILAQEDNIGDVDQFSIMSDAKNTVIMNIEELREFAESQTSLMDSIKSWLANVQSVIKIETNDPMTQEKLPDVEDVYKFLDQILRSYIEKSEKASFLHNDVNEFWTKQAAQLKKIIYSRDEEIRKLQVAIQAAQTARQRKTVKKPKSSKEDVERQAQQTQQIEQQIRLIQEQKAQIEKLKGLLQSSESERAVLQVGKSDSKNNINPSKSTDLTHIHMESEAKIGSLNQKISELLDELEKTRLKLTQEKEKSSSLTRKLTDKEKAIGEMEILLQKYLNQLQLEQQSKREPPKVNQDSINKEDFYLSEMKYNEKLQNLKAKHAQELISQAEVMNQKFLREKNMLLASLDSPNDQNLIKSIVNEYDKKFESQQNEYQVTLEKSNKSWAGKVSLLTRQYESRIANMNASHEIDLISARDSVKYEVKKAELDIEEKFNKEMLEMSNEKQGIINELQDDVDKKGDLIFKLEKQNVLLRQALEKYESQSILLKEEPNEEPAANEPTQQQKEAFIMERYLQRFNTLKDALEEQHQWALRMQKHYYERKMNKMITKHQKGIRRLLLDVQETVTEVEQSDKPSEDDKQEKIAEKITNTFVALNKQYEKKEGEIGVEDDDGEEMITLEEARKRTQLLTEKVVQLTNELEETKKTSQFVISVNNLKEQLKVLREKVAFLENIQNNDQKELARMISNMEEGYKNELRSKDELLANLQELLISYQNHTLMLTDITVIFHTNRSAQSPLQTESTRTYEYEYEEDIPEISSRVHYDLTNPASPKPVPSPKCPVPISPIPNSMSLSLKKRVKQSPSAPDRIFANDSPPPNSDENESKTPTGKHRRNSDFPSDGNNGNESHSEDPQELVIPQNYPSHGGSLTQRGQENSNLHSKKDIGPLFGPETVQRINNDYPNTITTNTSNQTHRARSNSKSGNTVGYGNVVRQPRKRTYYNMETQISLNEPIVEAALKSILEHLTFKKCDALTIGQGMIEFKDSKSVPKRTQQPLRSQKMNAAGFKAKLYFSSTMAIHRNDNFVCEPVIFEVINEESPQMQTDPQGKTMIRQILCSFAPKPQAPIVIHADEKQMDEIRELQEKLKEQNNDSRKHFLNEVLVESANRMMDTINKQRDEIKELRNMPPKIIYQPTIVSINDDRSDPFANTTTAQQMMMNRYQLNKNSGLPQLPMSGRSSQLGGILEQSSLTSNTSDFSESAILSAMPSNRSMSAKVRPREPIQFIVPPEEDIPDAKLLDDPFTAAVQAAASSMRYMAQVRDNESEIMETLRNDYTAYEAFLRASNQFNENNGSFIENLKDVKMSLEKTLTTYDLFNQMQHSMLNLVRQSKKKAMYMAKLYGDLQTKVSDEKLSLQSKSLAELSIGDKPIVVYEKVGAALSVVEKLGILMMPEDHQTFVALKSDYDKMKPEGQEKLDRTTCDRLLLQTQNFIEALKKKQSLEIEKSQLLSTLSQNEMRTIKHKYKKSLAQLDKMKRESAADKETLMNYKDMINSLKESLKNEQNLSEKTLTMYQSQINTLKDLLKMIDSNNEADGSNSSNPTDLTKKIRKEVLNMQTLLDTNIVELRDTRKQLTECQTRMSENEILIAQLKQELEESELRAADLDDKFRKSKDESIFRDIDEDQKKKEKENNNSIGNLQRQQLEKAQADFQLLLKKNHDIEQKLIKTRRQLNEATDEADELRLKFALKQFENTNVEKMSRETQTTFRIVMKRKSDTKSTKQEEKSTEEKDELKDNDKGDKEIDNEKDEKKDTNEENQEEEDEGKENSDSSEFNEISLSEKNNLPPIFKSNSSSMNAYQNSSSLSLTGAGQSTEALWVEVEGEKDDDLYNDKLEENNSARETEKDGIDDVYVGVHQPLQFKNQKRDEKRKKYFILNDPKQKKPRKPLQQQHPVVVPQPPAAVIAIGFGTKQPTRSISSASSGRSRLVTTPVNAANYFNDKKPVPDLKVSATAVPAIINGGIRPKTPGLNNTPKNEPSSFSISSQRPQTAHHAMVGFPTNSAAESLDTLVITNVQFSKPPTDQKPPMVDDPAAASNRKSTSVASATRNVKYVSKFGNKTFRSSGDEEEIRSLISRLRNKIKKLTRSNEKKDETILELNRKLSQFAADLNRAKIDNIRERDSANRAKIRLENIGQRLQTAMGELVDRQEESSALRRQLIHLKHAAAPAAPLLRRMSKAQREQERINSEQKQTRTLLEDTRRIMGETKDEAVRDHLTTLIRNTQHSLLRMEAKRRYWQDVERKQMLGALSALSLITQDAPDVGDLALPYTSLFRTIKKAKNNNGNNLSVVVPRINNFPSRDVEDNELFPIDKKPLLTMTNGENLIYIDAVKPPLSGREMAEVASGELLFETEEKITHAKSEVISGRSMDGIVVTNS